MISAWLAGIFIKSKGKCKKNNWEGGGWFLTNAAHPPPKKKLKKYIYMYIKGNKISDYKQICCSETKMLLKFNLKAPFCIKKSLEYRYFCQFKPQQDKNISYLKWNKLTLYSFWICFYGLHSRVYLLPWLFILQGV